MNTPFNSATTRMILAQPHNQHTFIMCLTMEDVITSDTLVQKLKTFSAVGPDQGGQTVGINHGILQRPWDHCPHTLLPDRHGVLWCWGSFRGLNDNHLVRSLQRRRASATPSPAAEFVAGYQDRRFVQLLHESSRYDAECNIGPAMPT